MSVTFSLDFTFHFCLQGQKVEHLRSSYLLLLFSSLLLMLMLEHLRAVAFTTVALTTVVFWVVFNVNGIFLITSF